MAWLEVLEDRGPASLVADDRSRDGGALHSAGVPMAARDTSARRKGQEPAGSAPGPSSREATAFSKPLT